MSKSMIDVAKDTLIKNNHRMAFLDLWNNVSKEMNFSPTQAEDNIAQFYSDLSLDSHFVNLEGNSWDLKTRHTFSETVTDTDMIAVDDDDEEEEEIEEEIQKTQSEDDE